jgi:hypothetical protein
MYINYMGWNLLDPGEPVAKSYMRGTIVLSFISPLENALYSMYSAKTITGRTLQVTSNEQSRWGPEVSVGSMYVKMCRMVYAYLVSSPVEEHSYSALIDRYSKSAYGSSYAGSHQPTIAECLEFVAAVCTAMNMNDIYVIPYGVVLAPGDGITLKEIVNNIIRIARRDRAMPWLAFDPGRVWAPDDPPIGALCPRMVIKKDAVMKRDANPCRRAFLADNAGLLGQIDSSKLAYDVELLNAYVLYCSETEDISHFISIAPGRTLVIFVGERPRLLIDGSIKCIIRHAAQSVTSDESNIHVAMLANIDPPLYSVFPTDVDGEDDDDNEPPVVTQDNGKRKIASLTLNRTIRPKGGSRPPPARGDPVEKVVSSRKRPFGK